MEIVYVAMSDMSWSEMMALKAAEDPMLMRERRIVIATVKRTDGTGT